MNLVALFSVFAFTIGCAEFLSIGMTPSIVKEFGVANAQAGLLIVFYAFGVVIGGPALTILTSMKNKKKVLFSAMFSFALINLTISLMNNFIGVLFFRFAAGSIHGLFFGMATAVVRQVSEKNYAGRNLSRIFTAFFSTMAIGVPVGSFLAQHISFRWVFAFISSLAVFSAFSFWKYAPDFAKNEEKITLNSFKAVFKNKRIFMSYCVGTSIFVSSFITQAYLGPFLQETSKFSLADLPLAFFISGLGALFGSRFSGVVSDRRGLTTTIGLGMTGYFLVIGVFIFLGRYPVVTLTASFFWTFFMFLTAPAITGNALRIAQSELPGHLFIIASINGSTINMGVMLGSLIGSAFVKSKEVSYLPYGSLVALCLSILFFYFLLKMHRRHEADV